MSPQAHVEAALRFLQLADLFTLEHDPLARSEMLWCAAAHIVKAVAVMQRPIWSNRSHNDLFDAAAGMTDTLGFSGAYNDFCIADRLHQNMYEGFMRDKEIAESERVVRRFVNRLAEAVIGN